MKRIVLSLITLITVSLSLTAQDTVIDATASDIQLSKPVTTGDTLTQPVEAEELTVTEDDLKNLDPDTMKQLEDLLKELDIQGDLSLNLGSDETETSKPDALNEVSTARTTTSTETAPTVEETVEDVVVV